MVARNAMPVTWVSQSGMDVRRKRRGQGITLPLPRRTPLAAAGAKGKRGDRECWYACQSHVTIRTSGWGIAVYKGLW